MKTNLLLPGACLAFLLLPGCSSYNREWRQAVQQPAPATSLAGAWEGHWISDVNGHNDRLRCVINENQAGEYSAHFRANYKRIFHFSYTVPLRVQPGADGYTFSGEADLGKLAGGLYTYAGNATGANFLSTYQSKYDHGKFEMTRHAANPR